MNNNPDNSNKVPLRKAIVDESGAIILEGMFAITIVIIVLEILLALGFYLYQRTVVTIVTNQVAEEISQTYKYKTVFRSSNITRDDVIKVGRYRYFIICGYFLQNKNKRMATEYASRRIPETSLAQSESRPEVTVKRVSQDIGRCHYEITVSQKYTFLFGGVLKMIGYKDRKFSSTAYAEGVDISNYVNTIRLAEYGLKKFTGAVPLAGAVDKVIHLMSTVFGIFNE